MLATMDFLTLGELAGGLVLLVGGGSLLVRSASRLAAAFGVPPLVVGLTVVAFGTSAPELAVSVEAARTGQAGLALGNVVGSNIFNVLFILGLSASITPLVVQTRFVRREAPLLIIITGMTWLFAANGRIGVLEGVALVLGLIAYTAFAIIHGRRETTAVSDEYAHEFGKPGARWLAEALLALIALAVLVLGSTWFVGGATSTARALGVSELAIGLIVVAPGTSLPEVVTSVIAALKGERDIAVGNVIGSCLFNLLGVLGITAVVGGGTPVPASALGFDFPVMMASALACLPVFLTAHRVDRWEGWVFLGYYAAYVTWLLLAASGHAAREAFGVAMIAFILPLTALALIAPVLAARRRRL
jgi:cation:H+ antiporter